MTREEALEILDTIPTIHEQVDALEMAIEALENQKSVIEELEKIMAEMESRVKLNNDLENYDISTGLSIALGILDKHISELKGE